MSSLFLSWDNEDTSQAVSMNGGSAGKNSRNVRVYCSNIGDSRCVMLRCYDTKEALSLPSTYIPRVKSKSELLLPNNGESISLPNAMIVPQQLPSNSPVGRFVAVHLMSEDHKLSLIRERLRIVTSQPPQWHSLPCSASPIFLPSYAKTGSPETYAGLPQLPKGTELLTNPATTNRTLPPIDRSKTFEALRQGSKNSSAPELSGGTGGGSPVTSKSLHSKLRPSNPNGGGPTRASEHGGMGRRVTSLHAGDGQTEHSTEIVVGNLGTTFDWGYPPIGSETAAKTFIEKVGNAVAPTKCDPKTFDPYCIASLADNLGTKLDVSDVNQGGTFYKPVFNK